MDCPYCNTDLLHLAWKYWAGDREEKFELICPECGNSLAVAASLSFDVYKLEDEERTGGMEPDSCEVYVAPGVSLFIPAEDILAVSEEMKKEKIEVEKLLRATSANGGKR